MYYFCHDQLFPFVNTLKLILWIKKYDIPLQHTVSPREVVFLFFIFLLDNFPVWLSLCEACLFGYFPVWIFSCLVIFQWDRLPVLSFCFFYLPVWLSSGSFIFLFSYLHFLLFLSLDLFVTDYIPVWLPFCCLPLWLVLVFLFCLSLCLSSCLVILSFFLSSCLVIFLFSFSLSLDIFVTDYLLVWLPFCKIVSMFFKAIFQFDCIFVRLSCMVYSWLVSSCLAIFLWHCLPKLVLFMFGYLPVMFSSRLVIFMLDFLPFFYATVLLFSFLVIFLWGCLSNLCN